MFITITASILINLAVLCYFYIRFIAPQERGGADSSRLSDLKSELADLLTDLNHVANTHVNAIENRKAELMRVLEAANRKIVRVNSLISDLEIMQSRLEKQGQGASRPKPAIQDQEPVYRGGIEREVLMRHVEAPPFPSREQEEIHEETPALDRKESGIQTIIRLAREGWSPEDIAAHVRMSVHQVRQVLGLSGAGYGRN